MKCSDIFRSGQVTWFSWTFNGHVYQVEDGGICFNVFFDHVYAGSIDGSADLDVWAHSNHFSS